MSLPKPPGGGSTWSISAGASTTTSCASRPGRTKSPRASYQPRPDRGRPLRARTGSSGAAVRRAAWRQLVAAFEADGEAEVLEFPHVELERCGVASERGGQSGGAGGGMFRDRVERGTGPRPVRAVRVEPVEPAIDVRDILGRECARRCQLGARVGLFDEMERDARHRQRHVASEVGTHVIRCGVAGASCIARRDRFGSHERHVVRFDDSARRPVSPSGHDLRSFPPPERHGDGTVRDQRPETRFPEHRGEATASSAVVSVNPRPAGKHSGVDVSERERLGTAEVEAPERAGFVPGANARRSPTSMVTEPRASSGPRHLSPWFWTPLLAVSLLLAAYTGCRGPDRCAATLYTVSLQGGFHRRFLVGSLLHPLSEAFDYDYWLYATVAFVILGAVLVVLCVAALRARLVSQRFLVIAFLLLPTGGFLFHEVGYLDQLLYLLLFGSLWVLPRRAWIVAPALMTIAVLSHEIAILTVLPVLGFAVLRELDVRRAIAVLAPPAFVGLVILAIPATETGAVERLNNTLRVSNFRPRADALALFQRSQSESWKLYSPRDVFLFLLPLAVVSVAAFLLLYFLDGRSRHASALYAVLASGAIGAPVLLAFAGWDEGRWAFLLIANFFIVTWIWLGDRGRELSLLQAVTLGFVLLVGLHFNLQYFDGDEPRPVRPSAIRELSHQIEDGTLFDIRRR